MSPEQLAAVSAVITIITKMESWPLWLVFIGLGGGPWIALLLIIRTLDKRAASHELKAVENLAGLKEVAEAGWKAYGDNVMLVEETQAIAKSTVALGEQLAEIIHLNTQVQTRLVEKVDNNMFCPLVRKEVGKT